MAKVKDAIEEWVKGLKDYQCFPSEFRIVFPRECDGCGEAISKLRKSMSQQFGGTTEWDGDGCWIDPKGKEICEPVKVLMSAHNCAKLEEAKKIGEAIVEATKIANQEAVFISAGNKFYILPKEGLIPKEKE